MPIPISQFISPLPLGIHTFVLYVCVSISALQIRSSITTRFLTNLKRECLGCITCWTFHMLPIFLLCPCSWMTILPWKEPILPWAVATTSLSTVIIAGGLGDRGVCGSSFRLVLIDESRNLWLRKGAQRWEGIKWHHTIVVSSGGQDCTPHLLNWLLGSMNEAPPN